MKTTVTSGFISKDITIEFSKEESEKDISFMIVGEVRKSITDAYPYYPNLQIQVGGKYCGQLSKQGDGTMSIVDVRGDGLLIVGDLSNQLSILDSAICEAFNNV